MNWKEIFEKQTQYFKEHRIGGTNITKKEFCSLCYPPNYLEDAAFIRCKDWLVDEYNIEGYTSVTETRYLELNKYLKQYQGRRELGVLTNAYRQSLLLVQSLLFKEVLIEAPEHITDLIVLVTVETTGFVLIANFRKKVEKVREIKAKRDQYDPNYSFSFYGRSPIQSKNPSRNTSPERSRS